MPVPLDAWYALTWVEWLGVAGVVLTLAGLGLTWRQARDAKTAARAASDAVSTTQRQLRVNQLLVLIAQMRAIASALDESIHADDARLARKDLDSWRWTAANVHGILSADGAATHDILTLVQESVGLAFSANTALIEGKRPVLPACKKARISIGDVCNELTSWAGNQSLAVDEESETVK